MSKVSIITPFKNAQTWMPRAIESVLAQTHTDWELLLVNDGSHDDSPAIADDYARRDPRISVHHKESIGVGAARNTGLQHMTGEYCLFLDADDTLEPNALEVMVRAMEEIGIGRPSTYAPTIGTLLGRHYVTKENKNLYVTELGEAVNDIMQKYFSDVVDEGLTARMESALDRVGEGQEEWKKPLRSYYPRLMTAVEKAEGELEKVTIADEVSDELCEVCGRNLVIKYGPHGRFLACPGFPECRFTKPLLEKTGIRCPKCGGEVLIKKTRKGRRYYGCENSPECDYMSWQKPADKATED